MDALGDHARTPETPAEETGPTPDAIEEAATVTASILLNAEVEANAIRQRAYMEGRAAGADEGRLAARAEVVEELQALQSVALQVAAVRESILRGAEAEIIELTIEAARAVLGEAIARDPELVVTSVQRALTRATGANVLRIRVNPQDASVVGAYFDSAATPSGAAWEVTPDGAITVGGCIVDIEGGEIDARIDVQLDAIAGALRELVPFPLERTIESEWQRAA
jgi:flagellar biosynthesis/type III secretory pathway protein FliH